MGGKSSVVRLTTIEELCELSECEPDGQQGLLPSGLGSNCRDGASEGSFVDNKYVCNVEGHLSVFQANQKYQNFRIHSKE